MLEECWQESRPSASREKYLSEDLDDDIENGSDEVKLARKGL